MKKCDKTNNYILLYVKLFLISLIFSQTNTELEYKAERLEGFKSNLGEGRKLFENVEMWQDSILIKCDSALYYFSKNTADLNGNVQVIQNGLEIFSDKMFYYGNEGLSKSSGTIRIINNTTELIAGKGRYYRFEEKADFQKNVFIEDDTSRIRADRLIYFKETEESFAYKNVILKSKLDNIYLTADTIENYPQDNITIAREKPVLFKIDTVEQESEILFDTTTISSNYMEAFRMSGKNEYYFSGNVEIVKNNIKAIAENCTFFRDKELIVLKNNSAVFVDDVQLFADSIYVFLENNELKVLKAYNNAINVMYDDSVFVNRKNQIKGDSIIINFEKKQIKNLLARGQSKMLYFFFSDNQPDGVSRSSSEGIDVIFKADEANEIILHKTENGEEPVGNLFPEFLIENKIQEYYFKQYKWIDSLPVKKKLNLENFD